MTRAPSSLPNSMLSPISIDALRRLRTSTVDLYLQPVDSGARSLFAASDCPPTREDLDRLRQSGVKHLYVRNDQVEALHPLFEQLLASGGELASVERLAVAKELAKAGFAEAWRCSSADPLLALATHLADDLVQACQTHNDLAELLASLVDHDGTTFVHVTNVCVYAILLAANLGVSSSQQLREIGIGALLHDVGKRSILPNLLQKPGTLSPRERKELQLHPTRGFEDLCRRPDMTYGQLMMIYQHHERCDGSGYPVRAVAADIHWMAGICAVVDVFDALTGHRPYRRPASAEEALKHLTSRAGREYDAGMVHCWEQLVSESKATCT